MSQILRTNMTMAVVLSWLIAGCQVNKPLVPISDTGGLAEPDQSIGSSLGQIQETGESLSASLLVQKQSKTISVPKDSTVEVSWTSQGASQCHLTENGIPSVHGGLSTTFTYGPVTTPMTFVLSCEDSNHKTIYRSVSINVTDTTGTGPIAFLRANGEIGGTSIPIGQPVRLSWNSSRATSCELRQVGGQLLSTELNHSEGILSPTLTTETSFVLNCSGANNQSTVASVTVKPNTGAAPPFVQLYANGFINPSPIAAGSEVTLTWLTANATGCELTQSNGTAIAVSPLGTSGIQSPPINMLTIFRMTCTNSAGSTHSSVTVPVLSSPMVDLKVNQLDSTVSIAYGATANVTWSSQNVLSCSIQLDNALLSSSLNQTTPLTTAAIFSTKQVTATCLGMTGESVTDSVTISVGEPTDHLVFISSKLFTGAMGGIAGADNECVLMAQAANLRPGRTWRALLSSTDYTLRNHLPLIGPIRNSVNEIIVNNGPALFLTNSSGMVGVRYMENGLLVPGATANAWTATDGNGTFVDGACGQWTRANGDSSNITLGNSLSAGEGWMNGGGKQTCNKQARIYCMSF